MLTWATWYGRGAIMRPTVTGANGRLRHQSGELLAARPGRRDVRTTGRQLAAAQCPGLVKAAGSRVFPSPTADSSCGWVRNRLAVRSAPRRFASRRSAPSRSVQPRVAQVGGDQQGAAQVRAREIPSAEAGADQVCTRCEPLRWRHSSSPPERVGPHERAHAREQFVDALSDGGHVEREQRLRFASRHPLEIVAGSSELPEQGPLDRPLAGLREIPEQLVQLSHDGESVVHRLRGARRPPPVDPAERHLRHPLACAEAVERGTAAEPVRSQPSVDAAAEVGPQVPARLAGRLVERKVGRPRERCGDAAQTEAVGAVGPQA